MLPRLLNKFCDVSVAPEPNKLLGCCGCGGAAELLLNCWPNSPSPSFPVCGALGEPNLLCDMKAFDEPNVADVLDAQNEPKALGTLAPNASGALKEPKAVGTLELNAVDTADEPNAFAGLVRLTAPKLPELGTPLLKRCHVEAGPEGSAAMRFDEADMPGLVWSVRS